MHGYQCQHRHQVKHHFNLYITSRPPEYRQNAHDGILVFWWPRWYKSKWWSPNWCLRSASIANHTEYAYRIGEKISCSWKMLHSRADHGQIRYSICDGLVWWLILTPCSGMVVHSLNVYSTCIFAVVWLQFSLNL